LAKVWWLPFLDTVYKCS